MKESYGEGLGAAMLAAVPVGESPTGGACSVATVAISGGGKGDCPVESPEVKAPVAGRNTRSDPPRGRATPQAVANAVADSEPGNHEITVPSEADDGVFGSAERSRLGEGQRRR